MDKTTCKNLRNQFEDYLDLFFKVLNFFGKLVLYLFC